MCIAEASARPSLTWALAKALSSSRVILINSGFFSVLNQRYSVWDFICNAFPSFWILDLDILDFELAIRRQASLPSMNTDGALRLLDKVKTVRQVRIRLPRGAEAGSEQFNGCGIQTRL